MMTLRDSEQARKALLEDAQATLDNSIRGTTETATYYALVAIGQALVAIGHALNGTRPGEDAERDA